MVRVLLWSYSESSHMGLTPGQERVKGLVSLFVSLVSVLVLCVQHTPVSLRELKISIHLSVREALMASGGEAHRQCRIIAE